MKKLIVALALFGLAVPAAALDLGVAVLNSQSGAQSTVGSTSNGASIAAPGAGLTAQGSQASANNGSLAGTVVSGNNTFAFSGSTGATAQSGFGASLGSAASANGNLAAQAGQGLATNVLNAGFLFIQP
jgi:hypothetical protein